MNNNIYDLIILGGGASGLMAALTIGVSQKKILILDSTDDLARKIRISGGGKCNFSNIKVTAQNYISQNTHFCKSALARYDISDFKKLMAQHNLKWTERNDGKLFSFSGDDIAEMLLEEVQKQGVEIRNNCLITDVTKKEHFYVSTPKGDFYAHRVLVATGGLSIPKIGASSVGFDIAKSFGLKVEPLKPALTGFLWDEPHRSFVDLAGLSCPVEINIGSKKISGDLLFTHKGISGPVVLNASLYFERGMSVQINFLPNAPQDIWNKGKTFITAASTVISRKLACALLAQKDRDIANATKEQKQDALLALTHFEFTPLDLEGFQKAEVTKGGVSTNELNQSTLECKKIAGLYFAGEAIDVTGQLGGYNLHWAWASGYAVGHAVKEAFACDYRLK